MHPQSADFFVSFSSSSFVSLPVLQAPHYARTSGCIWVSASHPARWTVSSSRSSEKTSTSALYLVSPIVLRTHTLAFFPTDLCPEGRTFKPKTNLFLSGSLWLAQAYHLKLLTSLILWEHSSHCCHRVNILVLIGVKVGTAVLHLSSCQRMREALERFTDLTLHFVA